MASIRQQLDVDKPLAKVISTVLADLAPVLQRQGYRIDSQSSDGVVFVRKRNGLAGVMSAPKTIAVNVVEAGGATRLTIVGQGPGRLKRAIESL